LPDVSCHEFESVLLAVVATCVVLKDRYAVPAVLASIRMKFGRRPKAIVLRSEVSVTFRENCWDLTA